MGGTHTRRKPRWSEPSIGFLPVTSADSICSDLTAEKWLGHVVAAESYLGITEGFFISVALTFLNKRGK